MASESHLPPNQEKTHSFPTTKNGRGIGQGDGGTFLLRGLQTLGRNNREWKGQIPSSKRRKGKERERRRQDDLWSRNPGKTLRDPNTIQKKDRGPQKQKEFGSIK